MTQAEKSNFEYPSIKNEDSGKKKFSEKLKQLMLYQQENTTQLQKSAFLNEQLEDGQKLLHIEIKNQLFKDCSFYSSRIIGCRFTECVFISCNFSNADFMNVKFIQCEFRKSDFSDSVMQDVDASTSKKIECLYNNVNFVNNVTGFQKEDKNIISDSVKGASITKDQKESQSFKAVSQCMKQFFPQWKLNDGIAFQLTKDIDENTGLAIYPDFKKEKQVWQFVFFYGDQAMLMSDYDLTGKNKEQIKQFIEDWMDEVIIQSSQSIIKNILTILKEKQ